MSIEARAIIEARVIEPALSSIRCDFCSDKQEHHLIEVRSAPRDIPVLRICGKCANRLVWILPMLVKKLGTAQN